MKYTNKYHLPETVVSAVINDTYDVSQDDPNILNVSSLINSPLSRQLRIRNWNNIVEDVSANIWRLLGTAVHEVLDRVEHKDYIKEKRLTISLGNIRITGKADLYNMVTKLIYDYKVTSAWAIVNNPNGKAEWIAQLNCYAWLFRRCGYEVLGLTIVAILRDHSKHKANGSDYPAIPITVPNMPLWEYIDQYEFVKERALLHSEANDKPISELPICNETERWRSDDVFAVHKGENKKALRLFDTMEKAEAFKETFSKDNPKDTLNINVRAGEDRKCLEYCNVNGFCPYWLENYGEVNKYNR